MLVNITQTRCIGCGLCVTDCPQKNLMIKDGRAATVNDACMQCGHCVAICPENAVDIDDYDMNDVVEITKTLPMINSVGLLNTIKARRSMRQFKEMPVERDKLAKIIEAGRYTPTASNRQEISYIVVQNKIQKFRGLVIEALGKAGEATLKQEDISALSRGYAERWINIYNQYLEQPTVKDGLFFKVPALILIAGDSALDIGLVASNMELMAETQGLGVLYSGFISRACQHNAEIKALLGIKPQHEVMSTLLVGYPDVTYARTAPRKKPEISWS